MSLLQWLKVILYITNPLVLVKTLLPRVVMCIKASHAVARPHVTSQQQVCSARYKNRHMQVDLMRVLSVPQLSSGTVDLVRDHPLLTNRQPTYAGSQELKLDDVELQGQDADPSSSSSSTSCSDSKFLLTS